MKFLGWSGLEMHLAIARLTEKTRTGFYFTAEIPMDGQIERWSTRLVPVTAGQRKKEDELYPAGVLVRPTFSGKGTGRRRVHAACYHAHGHFMRALFEMNPEGKIITAVARYVGVDGFNNYAASVAYKEMGSIMQPMQYRELCDCFEHRKDSF